MFYLLEPPQKGLDYYSWRLAKWPDAIIESLRSRLDHLFQGLLESLRRAKTGCEVSQLFPKHRWDKTKVASCMGQVMQAFRGWQWTGVTSSRHWQLLVLLPVSCVQLSVLFEWDLCLDISTSPVDTKGRQVEIAHTPCRSLPIRTVSCGLCQFHFLWLPCNRHDPARLAFQRCRPLPLHHSCATLIPTFSRASWNTPMWFVALVSTPPCKWLEGSYCWSVYWASLLCAPLQR